MLCLRVLSCNLKRFDTVKKSFGLLVFHVIEQRYELVWMEGAEGLVDNLMFGLRRGCSVS